MKLRIEHGITVRIYCDTCKKTVAHLMLDDDIPTHMIDRLAQSVYATHLAYVDMITTGEKHNGN